MSRILDPSFKWIPAASHDADSTLFRERQRQRMLDAQKGISNVEVVTLDKRKVTPIKRAK